jgi:hypothetical protein
MHGRDPAAVSSHHERRKGEGMGRLSTKESQASAYAPSMLVTLTRIPVGLLASRGVFIPADRIESPTWTP